MVFDSQPPGDERNFSLIFHVGKAEDGFLGPYFLPPRLIWVCLSLFSIKKTCGYAD